MSQIASRAQLRMSFLRWVLVLVPLVMLLGVASGVLAGSGGNNPWYAALTKPSFQPPSWIFGVVWPILYLFMGLALAIIVNARGSRLRGVAIALFAAQLAANLAWAPLFFSAHRVTLAAWWLLLVLVLAGLTLFIFGRVRTSAALLLLPYLAWLTFAAALAWQIDRLNPDGETLAPGNTSTQIAL